MKNNRMGIKLFFLSFCFIVLFGCHNENSEKILVTKEDNGDIFLNSKSPNELDVLLSAGHCGVSGKNFDSAVFSESGRYSASQLSINSVLIKLVGDTDGDGLPDVLILSTGERIELDWTIDAKDGDSEVHVQSTSKKQKNAKNSTGRQKESATVFLKKDQVSEN